MAAFVLHCLAAAMLLIAAAASFTRLEVRQEDRLRLGFAGMSCWMVADLIAQWVALGPPWGGS